MRCILCGVLNKINAAINFSYYLFFNQNYRSMETKSFTKYIAEFLGTFCLVLFGCGAAVIAGASADGIAPSGIGLLGIALAFGLSVVVMAYTIGPISGCHINPAISVAMLAAGQLSAKDTIGYVVSQCLGAIAASSVLYLILSGKPGFEMAEYALGANGWGKNISGNILPPQHLLPKLSSLSFS